MNKKTKLVFIAVATLMTAIISGCMSPEREDLRAARKIEQEELCAANKLDDVERYANEWGRLVSSDFLLIPDKGQFKIDYSTNVEFYINQARNQIQGGESQSYEQIQQVLESLKADVAPPVSLGQAGSATASQAQSNTSGSASSATPTPGNAKDSLANDRFSELLKLTQQAPGISERQATLFGFNDKIAEVLLKLIANPENIPSDKAIYFGIMQISCQPGWRTRNGYVADLNITTEYARDVTTTNPVTYITTNDMAHVTTNSLINVTKDRITGDLTTNILNDKVIANNVKHQVITNVFIHTEIVTNLAPKDVSTSTVARITTNNVTVVTKRDALIITNDDWTGRGVTNATTDIITNPTTSEALTHDVTEIVTNNVMTTSLIIVTNMEVVKKHIRSRDPGMHGSQPTILAVLPLIDSQRLDLQNSQRKQQELALQFVLALSAKGLATAQSQSQYQSLLEFLTRQQADMKSRTSVTLASSYTDSTGFGCQVYPEFQALDESVDVDQKSAAILQPVSFPLVVVLEIDKNDVFEGSWTGFRFSTHPRWIRSRRDRKFSFYSGPYSTWNPLHEETKEQTVADRVKNAQELDDVESTLKHLAETPHNYAYMELRRNYRALSEIGTSVGLEWDLPAEVLPSPKKEEPGLPSITSIAPTSGWINASTVFSIQGTDFGIKEESAVKSVTVGGKTCDVSYVSSNLLIATLAEWDGETTSSVDVVVNTKAGSCKSNAITFSNLQIKPEYPAVSIARDEKGNVTSVSILKTGAESASNLMDQVTKILTAKSDSADGNAKTNGTPSFPITITPGSK